MFQHKRRASSKLLLVREESFVTFGYVASYSEKIEETFVLAKEDRAPQISTTHKFSASSWKQEESILQFNENETSSSSSW